MIRQWPPDLAPERGLPPAALTMLWALAFALAYSQSPLYTSNQNQYFLHGAARAGIGFLSQDWLANTVDSVPVFTFLVEWTFRLFPPWVFYLYQALLLGLYLIVLMPLVWPEDRPAPGPKARWALAALLIGLQCAGTRFVLARALGPSWDYFFDGGVAGQRLLGPVFQPSVFGTLLLVSVFLYLRGRPLAAAAAAAAAATIHPTYLLSAAVLTSIYLVDTWRQTRRLQPALALGGTSLLLALPITLYVLLRLGPTGAAVSAEAQRILVAVRIPHHTLLREWLDAAVILKAMWIGAALVLDRRSRLFPVLAGLTVSAVCLTLLQAWTASDTLALLFPWRLSVLLVPLATARLCGRVLHHFMLKQEKGASARLFWVVPLAAIIIALCAAAGIVRFALETSERRNDPSQPMMAFVRSNLASGDRYLIPPGLQDFRLATGAPVLVDFKSIPYRDVEVLEWYQRLRLAQWFFRDRPEEVDCSLLETLAVEYGITHVVLDSELRDLACPGLEPLYRDAAFAVARLRIR